MRASAAIVLALPAATALQAVVCARPALRMRRIVMTDDEESSSLERKFAEEQQRRQQPPSQSDEPFTGVREVILDGDGNARSIPKRPPPPAPTQSGQVVDLVQNPLFYFGVLISLGSLGLLLAIAAADSAAS